MNKEQLRALIAPPSPGNDSFYMWCIDVLDTIADAVLYTSQKLSPTAVLHHVDTQCHDFALDRFSTDVELQQRISNIQRQDRAYFAKRASCLIPIFAANGAVIPSSGMPVVSGN